MADAGIGNNTNRDELIAEIRSIQTELIKLDVKPDYFNAAQMLVSELAELLEELKAQLARRKKFLEVK